MNCDENFLNTNWYFDYMLVQEVIRGNTKAWNRLYCDNYTVVYYYVKRIRNERLISHCEVKDVVDEAFYRCYLKLHTYMGKSKFSTWVCGFCRYILLKLYHKDRLQNKYLTDIFMHQSIYAYISPEDIVIKNERNFCIWTAFYSLSYKHQILIKCYILDEIKPVQLKTFIRLNAKDRKEELFVAIQTLRRRFIALYGI